MTENKAQIKHFRNYVGVGFTIDGSVRRIVDAKGGATIAYYVVGEIDEKVQMMIGLSFCNNRDNFCRKTGRNIALKRLVDDPISIELEGPYDSVWQIEQNLAKLDEIADEKIFNKF